MYAKRLIGRSPLYFQYAPPRTNLDDVSADLPKAPYRGAPAIECSVYYYWWAFLRENESYIACCERGGTGEHHRLYEDFGDVRGDDFFDWWKQVGRLLFCEPDIGVPTVHAEPPRQFNDRQEVLMTVPITGDLERTMIEIRALLKPAMEMERQRRRGRDDENRPTQSKPRYVIYTNPVIATLYRTLKVHLARKAVGVRANQQAVRREALRLMQQDSNGENVGGDLTSSTITRYEKGARHLIANVIRGQFPNTDDPVTGAPLIVRKYQGADRSVRKRTS